MTYCRVLLHNARVRQSLPSSTPWRPGLGAVPFFILSTTWTPARERRIQNLSWSWIWLHKLFFFMGLTCADIFLLPVPLFPRPLVGWSVSAWIKNVRSIVCWCTYSSAVRGGVWYPHLALFTCHLTCADGSLVNTLIDRTSVSRLSFRSLTSLD